jgi:D-tyrosyl-tRNA(Tyr) deacylase
MRVVLQRVSKASVISDGVRSGSIERGLLVLVGFEATDEAEDIDWLCNKICNMRIFSDENNHMNQSLLDTKGELLIISQFTLHAKVKKGNRPSFIKAARPEQAIPLYEEFKAKCASLIGKDVASGIFGADMQVSLINDGPVTITVDSKVRE